MNIGVLIVSTTITVDSDLVRVSQVLKYVQVLIVSTTFTVDGDVVRVTYSGDDSVSATSYKAIVMSER